MSGGPMADQGCHGKLTCNRAVTGCHRLSQAVTAVTAVTGCHMLSHDITSVTAVQKRTAFASFHHHSFSLSFFFKLQKSEKMSRIELVTS